MNTETPFEKFLNQHDEEAWSATLATLLRSIHEVDRNATQIWFAFYPLSLFRALHDWHRRQTREEISGTNSPRARQSRQPGSARFSQDSQQTVHRHPR